MRAFYRGRLLSHVGESEGGTCVVTFAEGGHRAVVSAAEIETGSWTPDVTLSGVPRAVNGLPAATERGREILRNALQIVRSGSGDAEAACGPVIESMIVAALREIEAGNP